MVRSVRIRRAAVAAARLSCKAGVAAMGRFGQTSCGLKDLLTLAAAAARPPAGVLAFVGSRGR